MLEYEIVLIFPPDLGEAQTEKELKEIKSLLTGKEGEITYEENWGLKDLAYRIKKQEQGIYVILNFNSTAAEIAEIEKNLNIHQNLLRYLITKTPGNYTPRTQEDYDKEAKLFEDEKDEKKKQEEKPKRTDTAAKRSETKKAEEPKKLEEEPKEEKVEKVAVPVEKSEEEPVPKVEEEPEKEEKDTAEPIPEPEPTPEPASEPEPSPKKEEEQSSLDEVDEKLRSIIDDPDITL